MDNIPHRLKTSFFTCRRYAERQGWKLLEEHVYTDEALSGMGVEWPLLSNSSPLKTYVFWIMQGWMSFLTIRGMAIMACQVSRET
jgi:hypothetical protein